MSTEVPVFHSIAVTESGCWVPSARARDKDGYILAHFNNKHDLLHRHVYRMFHGMIPAGMVVRHKCDNRECANPLHLELGTVADNVADRVSRGRSASGESNGRAIFTADQVREMRANPAVPDSVYADRFGSSLAAVRDARTGRNWSQLAG